MPIRPFCGSEDAILVLITYDVNTEDAAGRRRPRPQVLLPTGRTTHSIKVRTDSGHTLSGRLALEQDPFFAELPGSHRCDSITSAEMDAAFSHVTNAQVYFCAYLLSLPTRGAWIEIHLRSCHQIPRSYWCQSFPYQFLLWVLSSSLTKARRPKLTCIFLAFVVYSRRESVAVHDPFL